MLNKFVVIAQAVFVEDLVIIDDDGVIQAPAEGKIIALELLDLAHKAEGSSPTDLLNVGGTGEIEFRALAAITERWVIERQLEAREYDEQFDEFLELNTKIGLLREEKPTRELEESAKLEEIEQRAETLKSELDETVMGFDEPETAFQDLV